MTKPWDPQDCRNGCGQKIYLQKVGNKWIPKNFENGVKTETSHECPNRDASQVKQTVDLAHVETGIALIISGIERIEKLLKDTLEVITKENSFKTAEDLVE